LIKSSFFLPNFILYVNVVFITSEIYYYSIKDGNVFFEEKYCFSNILLMTPIDPKDILFTR